MIRLAAFRTAVCLPRLAPVPVLRSLGGAAASPPKGESKGDRTDPSTSGEPRRAPAASATHAPGNSTSSFPGGAAGVAQPLKEDTQPSAGKDDTGNMSEPEDMPKLDEL